MADTLQELVRQAELFFVVAALAGVGWTISASELWVAAQRTIPAWARGRLNAMVIMVSQGAMAIGGVIWGSAAAIAGASSALLWAAVLFLGVLVLVRQLSIITVVEPKSTTQNALTKELIAACRVMLLLRPIDPDIGGYPFERS